MSTTHTNYEWEKSIYSQEGGKHFYIGISGNNDVGGEEEEGVSEVNILASEASKLSAGDRILRGP